MTDQTTAAPPGPGLAGTARKGPGPTPRDLAARAASRDADTRPGAAQPGAAAAPPRPPSAPALTRARATTRPTAVTPGRAASRTPRRAPG